MFSLYELSDNENQTYGLKSLSTAFRQTLQLAFEHYAQCKSLFFDMKLTPTAVWRARLREVKRLPGLPGIRALKQLTNDMADEQRQVRQQQRRAESARQLTPGLFHRLRTEAQTPYVALQLQRLEQRWQSHGGFAHFGDQALLRAMKHLEMIETFVQFAFEELEVEFLRKHWFREEIPEGSYQRYKTYLEKTLATVTAEKASIAASMCERLHIAAKKRDLAASDVLLHTVDRLKSLAASVNQSFGASVQRARGLTPELFHQYHDYVFSCGSEETKQRALQLPWFNFKTTAVVNSNPTTLSSKLPLDGQLALKQQLAKQFGLETDVPTSRRRPQWLFKGNHVRYQFFDNVHGWASLVISVQRAAEQYDANMDEASFYGLSVGLVKLDSAFIAFEDNVKQAEMSTNSFFRKFFTQRTQRFLLHIEGRLQEIKTTEQAKLVQYLKKMEHRLNEGTLLPTNRVEQSLQSIQLLRLAKTPEIAAQFAVLGHAFKQAKAQQQAKEKRAARLKEAKKILAPLQQQSRLAPAETEEVIRAIEYYHALPARDDVVNYVIAEMENIVRDAKQHCAGPVPVMVDDSREALLRYQRDYQYLTNLCRILMSAGKQTERQVVDNKINDVLCDYLQTWAGISVSATNPVAVPIPLSIEHMHAKADVQATFIETLGDDAAIQFIQQTERLRHEGHYEALCQLATAHFKKHERRQAEREFIKKLKQVEAELFHYITSKSTFALTPAQTEHLSHLAEQMLEAKVSDIRALPKLTATDKAFLGIGTSTSFYGRWFSNRHGLMAIVNMVAIIRAAIIRLPYLQGNAERKQYVGELYLQLEQQCKLFGDKGLQRLVQHHHYFVDEKKILLSEHLKTSVPSPTI